MFKVCCDRALTLRKGFRISVPKQEVFRDRVGGTHAAGGTEAVPGAYEVTHQIIMKYQWNLAAVVFLLVTAASIQAADLRITDSGGVELFVREVTIDYGGLLGNDRETDGIRVSQGEALVTAKWTDIESLTVTGRDEAASRMTIEIVLKGGKKVVAMLVRKGRMRITGLSDLGAYNIDLEKVKKITVASAK